MSKALLLFLFAALFFNNLFAQNGIDKGGIFLQADKKNYAADIDQIQNLYKNIFYNELGYIDGKEYKPVHPPGRPNPYLESKQGKGTVYIKGKSYKDIALTYDILSDDLLTIPKIMQEDNYMFANFYIRIGKAMVDSFTITVNKATYKLENIQFSDDKPELLNEGYYEIPYKGIYKLLIRHRVTTNTTKGYTSYSYAPIKYLLVNGNYVRLSSGRKFVKFFPEHKKQIRRKMRQYLSPFRLMNKYQLSEIIQYAESL